MEDSTPLKKWLYDLFMNSAIASERRKLEGGAPTVRERLLRPIGEWLVCGPIKDQLGLTRLRHAFTGGEAIGEDTFVFYRALGVKLRQLYGQTESSAFNAMQDDDEVRLHTVGRPLPGVEVKHQRQRRDPDPLGAACSPATTTMPDATRRGARRRLAAHRRRRLPRAGRPPRRARPRCPKWCTPRRASATSRTTSRTASSSAPTSRTSRCSARAATRSPRSSASTRSRSATGPRCAASRTCRTPTCRRSPRCIELVGAAVAARQRDPARGLKLRRFVSLHKEFDADDGEITRTRKLRRNVVEERYAPIIDAIYGGQRDVAMKAQVTYETGEVGVTERAARR